MSEFTVKDLERMFANPMYCLKDVEGWHIQGEPIVDRETWIKANVKSVENGEITVEGLLRNILKNLEGQYYAIDTDPEIS